MEIEDFKTKLIADARAIDITLEAKQTEKLHAFIQMMKEWNEKINLTTITEDSEIISKHLVDSLTLFKTGLLDGKKTLIDVGTGAGFPAIPLKIVNDELEVTLLDATNKRLKYLNEVITQLEFKGITTLHSRAEDGGMDKRYRDSFDIATARALASIAVLAELCLPFVKVGGFFLCMKGPAYLEDLAGGEKAITFMGGKLIETIECKIPDTDYTHHILVIEKVKRSPKGYPRKAGTPNSDPIK